jgi:hypothetical protein
MLSVISSRGGLYLVPALLIDHGNGSSFRGMHLMYYRVPLNDAIFAEYRVAKNLVVCLK